MKKFLIGGLGLCVGMLLAFGLARFVYKLTQTPKKVNLEKSMEMYMETQKQLLIDTQTSEFDIKASTQLEQFLSDSVTLVDTAKVNPRHAELQQFATDSTYALAYNREGLRIILEDLGVRPKHGDGKHCDSVGC